MSNEILAVLGNKVRCKEVIISGGIKNFLDGYYLIEKLNTNAIYGQASAFLNHARGNYDDLATYIEAQVQGLILAKAMLKVK
jgi:isopentenyl-diphosphate delta-isomerase